MDYHQVTKMDKGIASKDGAVIRFETHTKSGGIIGLEVPTKNIGDIIAFLCGLAQHADKNKPSEQREKELQKGAHEGPLITPLLVGFAPGQTPQESVLVCQTGEFSLGFSLQTSALPALRAALAHMESTQPSSKLH